jgi:uncharacterized OsmC-like protein
MYHVDITNSGGSVFTAKSKDSEFAVDTKGAGMSPPDVLLASLGTCIGVYIRKYVERAKLELKDFTVSVDAAFTKEPPLRFQEISLKIDLRGFALDEQRKEALLRFIHNCPVHNTLKSNPRMDIALV